MRTARVLTVCTGGGGCTWSQRGVPAPGVPGPGGVPGLGGIPAPRGVPGPRRGVSVLGGVPGLGGCTWSQGSVSAPWGWMHLVPEGCLLPGGVPGPGGCQVLPPVNRMTNRCKNITLLQTSFAGGKYKASTTLC